MKPDDKYHHKFLQGSTQCCTGHATRCPLLVDCCFCLLCLVVSLSLSLSLYMSISHSLTVALSLPPHTPAEASQVKGFYRKCQNRTNRGGMTFTEKYVSAWNREDHPHRNLSRSLYLHPSPPPFSLLPVSFSSHVSHLTLSVPFRGCVPRTEKTGNDNPSQRRDRHPKRSPQRDDD